MFGLHTFLPSTVRQQKFWNYGHDSPQHAFFKTDVNTILSYTNIFIEKKTKKKQNKKKQTNKKQKKKQKKKKKKKKKTYARTLEICLVKSIIFLDRC